MNAITAHSHRPAGRTVRSDVDRRRHRRRAIVATVGATLLGLYVLGVSWFANELGSDMQRSLQIAPAVEDVAHR